MKNDIQMSIAHSLEPVFDVYLPSGNPKSNYTLRLVVHVRDMLGAWTESNIMTISVKKIYYRNRFFFKYWIRSNLIKIL